MDATARKRAREGEDAADTPNGSPAVREKRERVDDLHLAFVFDNVVKGPAQWSDPHKTVEWSAWDDATISLWAADQRN